MKSRTILSQQSQYTPLISHALDFSELILTQCQTLYPFALCSIGSSVQPIFSLPSSNDPDKLIEALQVEIDKVLQTTTHSSCLMVYSATTVDANDKCEQALLLTLTDCDLNNTVTMYPYTIINNDLEFKMPYTCDFYDD